MCNFCRRNFIRGAAAFGATSLFSAPRLAKAQPVATRLPARGEFVIRNGHVMTLDNALGDIAGGVVHVRDGEIIAVGQEVSAPSAEIIDATDMIVLPGSSRPTGICGTHYSAAFRAMNRRTVIFRPSHATVQ